LSRASYSAARVDSAIDSLERTIHAYGAPKAVVAFSGGVDSSVVLAMAVRALGSAAVTAVTAVSASYPAGELEAARRVAASIGAPHRTVGTRELERESYARNDPLRCFHCKTELYTTLTRLVAFDGSSDSVVLAGANADDVGDFRPGLRAAVENGVRNPLLEGRLGKLAVRAVARRLGLPVADKPALACLSSRVSYGIRITPDLLARIDRAERAVRRLGFDQVRVRHLGDVASIEVPVEQVDTLRSHPRLREVLSKLQQLGWTDVGVDPQGYRMGSLNDGLRGHDPSPRPPRLPPPR
jgi:uncharacterized protein